MDTGLTVEFCSYTGHMRIRSDEIEHMAQASDIFVSLALTEGREAFEI